MPPHCPRCAREVPTSSRFCPACGHERGTAAAPSTDATSASSAADATRTSIPDSPLHGTPAPTRFLPGAILAERYRIVGLIGRGGMGEVYRADDLKLGQSVALKFLPREVERDPSRLTRFLNEVRLALRVTHPNVCRVYDIGEVDGQHFLSMEYVDGEDLASLLRRIGRLPEERGVEIARQICAGLAAAHEQGILHRDLKPANVMIDGRGRARITDFGLAGLSGSIEGDEARAGTPAYMAPEQLAGGSVTTRSDVYALGLVLYEIFTGKPAFEVRSAAEMAARQRSGPPTTPSSYVRNLDPAIEAVLLRMLEPDAARRPASAVAVSAALPGGDPLAAALAAGETPSPEMVAEAGESGGLAPAWVGLLLAVLVVGVVGIAWFRPASDVLGAIETPLSLAALGERARLSAERLGFDPAPADTAHGLDVNDDYMRFLRDAGLGASEMRERVAPGRPAVYRLWYRQADGPLEPEPDASWIDADDPPLDRPGMVLLHVDPHARLVELAAVPPDREAEAAGDAAGGEAPGDAPGNATGEAAGSTADEVWDALFEEAGLDRASFREVPPEWTPPFYADARAAWEGVVPGAGDAPLRVEAAAFGGRPISFRIVGPWTRARAERDEAGTEAKALEVVFPVVLVGVLSGLAVLARHNLHRGRSDVRGAIRVGMFILLVELVAMLLSGRPFLPGEPVSRLVFGLAFIALVSLATFLAYIALEPFVRRNWPTILISWSRLLAGRLRDPLVGRDLLIGAAAGVVTRFLWAAHTRLPGLLGLAEEPLAAGAQWAGLPFPFHLSNAVSAAGQAVGTSMFLVLVLVLLRLVLRKTWIALAVWALFVSVVSHLDSPHVALDIGVHLVVAGLTLYVVLRVGLLALMSMWFIELDAGRIFTLDPSSWMWTPSLVYVVAILPVVAWAAAAALSGRTWLPDEI